MMTERQIELVKKSWKIFRDIDPVLVGDVFYSKLFIDHPELKRMFPDNMVEQYKKLIDMLSIVIGRLERLEELNADIAALAQRHVGYGVKPFHYKIVGGALIWTLKQGLGTDWNEEVQEAWITCFTILSDTMINASGYENRDTA
jgi:hemoglobin-like flavoprotein